MQKPRSTHPAKAPDKVSFDLAANCFSVTQAYALKNHITIKSNIPYRALWLSGYSDRLEIYFLREQEFESLRRRFLLLMF